MYFPICLAMRIWSAICLPHVHFNQMELLKLAKQMHAIKSSFWPEYFPIKLLEVNVPENWSFDPNAYRIIYVTTCKKNVCGNLTGLHWIRLISKFESLPLIYGQLVHLAGISLLFQLYVCPHAHFTKNVNQL